jgi:hypothetical protein
MSLLWADGFDQYGNTSDFTQGNYLENVADVFSAILTTTLSRSGTQCVRLGGSGGVTADGGKLTKYLGGDKTTVVVGFGYRSEQSVWTTHNLFKFRHYDGTSKRDQLTIGVSSSGEFIAWTGDGVDPGESGVEIARSEAGLIEHNEWDYIEIKATFGITDGEFEVRLNGKPVLHRKEVNTNGAGVSYPACNIAWFGQSTGWGYIYYDDLYVCDNTGAFNNDFLGPISVLNLMPNGDGLSSDCLPVGINFNYLATDNPTRNDDTEYVKSQTAGHKDYYDMEDIDNSYLYIFGVVPEVIAKKDTSGSRKVKIITRLAGYEAVSAEKTLSPSLYKHFTEIIEQRPGGGVWTIDDIDAMQLGIEVV